VKYQDCIIAWTPGTDHVRVGPLLREGMPDWTQHPIDYHRTAGASFMHVQQEKNPTLRDLMMMLDFHTIVVRDGVPVEAAHKAFLVLDEYRARISPDTPGADVDL
jgi:hypothetical protein